jgi:hypothetical protein
VPFDAAWLSMLCFVRFDKVFPVYFLGLLHQVMIVLDNIELFHIDKLTELPTSKCPDTDKLLS